VLAPGSHKTPSGHYYRFALPLNGSSFYDCTDATHSRPFDGHACLPSRDITVYIPEPYEDGAEAPLLVVQDGASFDTYLLKTVDALVDHPDPRRSLPPFVTVSISTGTTSDGAGSLRDIQYDTVSGKYADFVNGEVLPAVLSQPDIRADFPSLRITSDPAGRATLGCSSGGAAALAMAWFRPNLFGRVVAYSATLVAKDVALPSKAEFPLGAWEFHSPPGALIESSPRKPIRVFHSASEHDLGSRSTTPYLGCKVNGTAQEVVSTTEGCAANKAVCEGSAAGGKFIWHDTLDPLHSNWVVANNATAAALQTMGYETRYAYALSACHCDPKIFLQDLPSTLVWTWRGWARGRGRGQSASVETV